jgi:hypothetical protein
MQAGAKIGSCLRVSGVPPQKLLVGVRAGSKGSRTSRSSDATRIR